tara:strand:+ start:393 stop:914 length:522 start_codon:yes stop_codon:yes gene_type:complete
MRKTLSLLLASTITLTACGAVRESRINPFNWFGQSRSESVQTKQNTNPLIPEKSGGVFAGMRAKDAEYLGLPFDQVTNLTIERVPGGAIIRATGLAARQGYYAVQLTPANEDELPVDGVLTYRLEGVRPSVNTPTGTAPTREVIAARRVTDQDLLGVRSIRVEGQLNALVSRR